MSDITKDTVDQARVDLIKVLQPHVQNAAVMQRVNAFVFNKTTKKLTEYLNSQDVELAAKHGLLVELTAILKANDFDKLPTQPSGQAQQAPSAEAKPAPKPKPTPPAPIPAEPAAPDIAAEIADDEDPEVAAAKAQLALAAARAAAAKKAREAAAAAGITEERVRAIISEEIKTIHSYIDQQVDARLAELADVIVKALKK